MLFLFFIDGINDALPKGVQVSLYADDIAVWAQHRDKETAQNLVQTSVTNIANWSTKHKLNPSKCESTLFSTCPGEAKWSPEITLDGQTLKVNPTPTFLGVTFDRTLTFSQHAVQTKARIMKRIRILSALASKDWGCSRTDLLRIYHAIIHSVLNYCAPAWQPWLAKSNVSLLERVQNRALRALTGQLSDTPLQCLRLEAGITSFETTIKRNSAVAWEKSARLPWSNPRRLLFESPVFHRWKRNSWSDMAKEECNKLGLNDLSRTPLPGPGLAPWHWMSNGRLKINPTLMNNSKKNESKEAQIADTISSIVHLGSAPITIYTDGSAEAGLKNGVSAAVITTGPPSDPIIIETIIRKGSLWTSSYETEVTALLMATDWIKASEPVDHYIICSDSQSALSALDESGKDDGTVIASIRDNLASLTSKISLQWVPGHCGLIGNEWADKAANEAAMIQGPDCQPSSSISYAAAKCLILREIQDPPPTHTRTKEIYGNKKGITEKTKKIYKQQQNDPLPDTPSFKRRDAVLLAQLRSGHCHMLAAYRNVINQDVSPLCPHCNDEFETLEHWLCECPATAVKRIRRFGGAAPPLTVLVDDPLSVLAYAHELTSM